MSLKPTIRTEIPADSEAVTKTIGPMFGKLCIPNPKVTKYAFVLQFPSDGVVTSRALAHAIKKLPDPRGSVLIAANDLTVEARKMAEPEFCDVVSASEFGWTDAGHTTRMQR